MTNASDRSDTCMRRVAVARKREVPRATYLIQLHAGFQAQRCNGVGSRISPTSASATSIVLRTNPRMRVIVEGHTDSRGSEAYNEELSYRRARAVTNALSETGVSADQYEAQGLGKAYPVATNETAEGRQQNRRVEIVFSDDAGRFVQGASTEPSSLRR